MKRPIIASIVPVLLIPCITFAQTDIPYHRQSGPSCVQSQMLMAIKYFYPDREITQQDLDRRTGRAPQQWTWFAQAMPVLMEEGLDAYYYSSAPYQDFTPDFVNKYYGDNGPSINAVTNWQALRRSIGFLKTSNRYERKKLAWSEIEKGFREKCVILMIIDYNVLIEGPGRYAGHGVTITNITGTDITFHNSALGPNQTARKERFIEAWNAPGTDNDVIVVRGRIKGK